ncbi:MAG: flagellar type III secretion system pore protein FliP [Alcaligenaceae bacterium]|nr:flagellar type III secretion system pore protein FliP [Alcaligenaceae bacterium SAGV5]MPS52825.1 flagellar type III secretion system pore protein FliP [Alcaligenaceae bacterium SAGV3]MPT57444.1 flagellar type III secretion system pore protein FliP [Alcaligenaceae bacterium]
MMRALFLPLAALLLLAASGVHAQEAGIPALTSSPGPGGGTTWSLSLQTLLVLSALSFLPAVLLMMTSFTRLIIVLSLLRSALGLQGSPPNMVLIGLALFMTLFIMTPTFDRVYTEAYQPFDSKQIDFREALDKGQAPMKDFMLRQTRESDLALFMRLAGTPPVSEAAQLPLRVVVPAFVTSELKTAFQIGFMVFLPFLVIDLVVSSVLMSMGMMMLSPVLISLPFKLMLFVLADGWNLLIGSLVASFR